MLFTQGRELAVYYQRVFSEQIFNQNPSYLSSSDRRCSMKCTAIPFLWGWFTKSFGTSCCACKRMFSVSNCIVCWVWYLRVLQHSAEYDFINPHCQILRSMNSHFLIFFQDSVDQHKYSNMALPAFAIACTSMNPPNPIYFWPHFSVAWTFIFDKYLRCCHITARLLVSLDDI